MTKTKLGILVSTVIILLLLAISIFNIDVSADTSDSPAASTVSVGGVASQRPEGTIKLLVLGDMMFDRGIRAQTNARGFEYVFGPATTTFAQYDLVVANLEGPITTYKSKTVLAGNKAVPGFQFTFATSTATALKQSGIDMISLANNHTDNFGQDGLNQTRDTLTRAGIKYFGSPQNSNQIATSTCTNGVCIGFVGWHQFGKQNTTRILEEIRSMRPKVNYLVVFPHWGVEYKHSPTSEQTRLAKEWIDAGADAVIGAHPHVVQKVETYISKDGRNAPIFYSLGNFIFDQYFSFETTHGVGVEISFDKNTGANTSTNAGANASQKNISYKLIPFSSVGSKVSIPNASSTSAIFNIIESVSGKDVWAWLGK